MKQSATNLLMIQPVNFGFNAQTAVNNAFQKDPGNDTQVHALKEFNDFVTLLRHNKVDVTVVEDSLEPPTPDSIFPNNWISFHEDGRVILYPMFAANRRQERKAAVMNTIKDKFIVNEIIDLSKLEEEQFFLEGTGSMVLDRQNKIVYACLSARTDKTALDKFCNITGYTSVTFNACDQQGINIYHTNVMMCVGETYAVICLAAIHDEMERTLVVNSLQQTNKEIIDISLPQLNNFAGNMLQVKNADGELLLLMSSQAYLSLTQLQIEMIQKHNRILHTSLSSIEAAGGGSARCMMAEIFLERK